MILKQVKILFFLVMLTGLRPAIGESYSAPHAANPILPGYYADPSIVQYGGKTYIYATLDPWGGQTLGCWESPDFRNWTYRPLNWPTKEACTSPTSKSAGVWAPSVMEGKDGKFHMVVSVGNEVWAGIADQPLGPWRDAMGGKPLIPSNFRPGFHMIDAEYFLDDDGQAYLYWGSGLNWKNGRCWAVKLKPDMVTFDGEVQDVTPTNYFEGPFMLKRHGLYFLMYSAGNTMKEDYRVHYAVGKTPFGPFTEGPGSPILISDPEANVVSPGHHAVFSFEGRDYILYHRHSIPRDAKFMGRQVCVDPIVFTPDGKIERVSPTHAGPSIIQGREESLAAISAGAVASASSEESPARAASLVLDGNYATRWAPARDTNGVWLQLDIGAEKPVTRQIIRPEYAWKPYRFTIEASSDGKTWKTLADFLKEPAIGSPIVIAQPVTARYLRLVFPEDVPGSAISLFEWSVQ
ncbi:glycosyl hydrolase [Spartobacteria bacterium LR76]|nr:glycosyl hydrolase [Spartobacteria bacterium LR76]